MWQIASGVNFKYNYFIKGEMKPLSDITWRPGPQFSLSVPPAKKQERKIVVRDSWMRSKTESCPPHAWGSWIEEPNIPIKPSVSVQAEGNISILGLFKCNFFKMFLNTQMLPVL